MANGPLGGFMPTPAAPAQPPQVKLDTTADSRGNFNNFLKSMNGATSLNPPVMAPAMGAMAPNMAPALSNIDIFNQPVQMMQFGGSAMSGGAFSDAEIGEAIDSFGGSGSSNDSDDNTDDSPPDDDIDYTDVFTPDELQQATDIGRATSDSTSDGTTIANRNVKFTDLNQNQINEIKSQIDNRNMVALTEEDKFFKDGNLTPAGEAELNKRNEADFQLVSAGQVLPSEYLSTASDILGTGEKSVMDALDLDKPIDQFGIQVNPVFSPAMAGLPGVSSRFNVAPNVATQTTTQLSPGEALQRNVEQQRLAEAGRALGPTTFDDDLANFGANKREVQGPPEATQQQRVQELLDRGQLAQRLADRDKDDRIAAPQSMGVGIAPALENLKASTMGRPLGTETTAEPPPIVAPGIGAPKEFKDQFPGAGIKIGNFTIPTIFSLANEFSRYSRGRVLDSIAQKGYTPVYGGKNNDVIVGARDPNTGILMEGIDPNAPIGPEENDPTPIIRPLTPKKPEVDPKPDLPPNVIGGTALAETPQLPTVVESPFTTSTAGSTPITFDVGDLNRLIEQLTGVAARPVVSAKKGGLIGMANGGLIKAVDDFLAAS